ncbi:hypothetical protein DF146_15285 [Burkholderia cenocepacia]|nr:hypothetical protein DF165_11465 [Burkholderia cenocepacia]RQU53362.1 hypothetical protein DF146_15285 [Burkholderia cenocepacia]
MRSNGCAIFVLGLQWFDGAVAPMCSRITGSPALRIIGRHFFRFFPSEAFARRWPVRAEAAPHARCIMSDKAHGSKRAIWDNTDRLDGATDTWGL